MRNYTGKATTIRILATLLRPTAAPSACTAATSSERPPSCGSRSASPVSLRPWTSPLTAKRTCCCPACWAEPGYITWAAQLGIALDADSLDVPREATKRVYVEVPRFMSQDFRPV
jgi:hypothetical protein